MSPADQIRQLLPRCTQAERAALLAELRGSQPLHALEEEWHARAEVILEAIHRAGPLTRRMLKGVLAEAAFGVEVAERLSGWKKMPRSGDPPYDFLLKDSSGQVRVQVKLQRSKEDRPMWARQALRALPDHLYVVETQKTRRGMSAATEDVIVHALEFGQAA